MPHRSRPLSLALAAVVLLAAATAPHLAHSQNQQATVTVVAPKSVGASAKSVEIQINVENASNLAGFQFVLNVNSQVLQPVSVDKTGFLTQSGREILCQNPTIESGAVRFTCVTLRDTPPGVDGSGTLAVVTLKPSGKGTSPLALSHVKLVHPDGSELPSRTVDGSLSMGSHGWFTWWRAALIAGAGVLFLILLTAFIWRRRARRARPQGEGGLVDTVM